MKIAWIVGLSLIAVTLTLCFLAYRKAFYTPKGGNGRSAQKMPKRGQYVPHTERFRELMEELDARQFEWVHVTAYDGTMLWAKYYHGQDGAPLQIQFHGYRGSGRRDFCGQSRLAREMGHNILMVEQRSHGKSEGRTITFGIRERRDCLTWIHYARSRFGANTKLLLCGVSMGAATVLMASELELPGNVAGIIADCPYSSPKRIIQKVAKDMGLPPRMSYPFVWLGALLFGGLRIDPSLSAENAVKHARVPILLLHGEDDRFVPCSMGRDIARAGGEMVHLETFPGAGHALSFMLDEARYRRLVAEFCQRVLKEG